MRCACGDDDCWYLPGYPYCRSCGDHHRAPECDIDEQGRALDPFGVPWEVADARYFSELRERANGAA
jgi:hypothetical protein